MSVKGNIKAAVCGASGYAGAELLRLLSGHPGFTVTAVSAERSVGLKVTDLFPHLYNYEGFTFEPLDTEALARKADVFFLALPHAASQEAVDFFHRKGKPVVDLSADYRLSDPAVYEQWYLTEHRYRKTLKKAVYGLVELNRPRVRRASLVANPGCYPTGAILGLSPLLKAGLVDISGIVIDSKSGTSGAGRQSKTDYTYCEVNESFRAYGVGVHRHTPEIEQELSRQARKVVVVDFTAHLVPIDRGIITTISAVLLKDIDTGALRKAFVKAYAREPFVEVLNQGLYPNVKHVKGTNRCAIGVYANNRTGRAVVVTAIDNLIKGAAGQALQNMNLMTGHDERAGLELTAVYP